MITFDELTDRIGHRPHPDKLGGAKKMSPNYWVLQYAMPELQASMGAVSGLPAKDFTAMQQAALDWQLDEVITRGGAYKAQHAGTAKKTQAIDPVIASATQYKETLAAIADDPARASLPATITLEQAFELKRRGIAFADCKFDVYRDDGLDVRGSKDAFGSGACSTLDKLVYADGTEHYFKPEPANDED